MISGINIHLVSAEMEQIRVGQDNVDVTNLSRAPHFLQLLHVSSGREKYLVKVETVSRGRESSPGERVPALVFTVLVPGVGLVGGRAGGGTGGAGGALHHHNLVILTLSVMIQTNIIR